MAKDSKIGGSMFGYNKGDVNKYIGDLVENYNKESGKKDAEIKRLTAVNAELSSKVAGYEKTLAENEKMAKEYEAQKEIVASAIIKAEAEAVKIAEQANESAAARRVEIDDMLKSERMNLEKAKAELVDFQKVAIKLIKNFEDQIALLTGSKVSEGMSDGD